MQFSYVFRRTFSLNIDTKENAIITSLVLSVRYSVYRKKGKAVTRRLTFKKADVAFLTSALKRKKGLQQILQKSSQQLT